jgi:hypothetical protein
MSEKSQLCKRLVTLEVSLKKILESRCDSATLSEIREIANERKLDSSGTKTEICNRIIEWEKDKFENSLREPEGRRSVVFENPNGGVGTIFEHAREFCKRTTTGDEDYNKYLSFIISLEEKYGSARQEVQVIISPTRDEKYIAYCYSPGELETILRDNIYKNLQSGPEGWIFKEPYIGVWIDRKGFENTKVYNTLVVSLVENVDVSLYTLIPINFSKFRNHEKIRREDLENITFISEDYLS